MRYLFFAMMAGALIACNDSDKPATGNIKGAKDTTSEAVLEDTSNYTTIEWLDPVRTDLGKIAEGQTVEISWRFKNTGNKPLIIQNVVAGCGCTVAEKPQKPLAPGESDVIKARFNSQGQGAHVDKSVTVISNTKGNVNHILSFTAEIRK